MNETTQSVVITAFGTDGYPILESTVNATVSPGQEVEVDLGSATTEAVTIEALLVDPPSAQIPEGGAQQFTASLSFSNDEILPANNVLWSATGQASVDNTGLVTVTTSGVATVTATRDTATAEANIIVGDGPILTILTVTPDGLEAGKGSSIQFSVTGADQNGDDFPLTNVVWSIEAGSGTINNNTGLAEFPSATTATVRATVGTLFGEATIDILETIPAVVFSGDTLNELVFRTTQTPNIVDAMGEVTVSEDQANLQGGILRFTLTTPGNISDAFYTVPAATTIGTVSNNNTTDVSVLLNETATPAEIASLVESTTISFGGTVGTGTIQVSLSDGSGNDAVPATRAFSIPSPIPQVALDTEALTLDVGNPAVISTGATVMDDADPTASGTLSFSLTGAVTDAEFTIPATPVIGTINNNGTSNASVTLSDANLADIASVINTTTIAYGETKGSGVIVVAFTDENDNMVSDDRAFTITSLNLLVPTDFATVQEAVDEVAETPGADGSTITVEATFAGPFQYVFIGVRDGDNPNLSGLTLQANARGQSAGVTPDLPRNPTTGNQFLEVNQSNVTIDGFDFVAENASLSIFGQDEVIVKNCLFDGDGGGSGLEAQGNDLSVIDCGFQSFPGSFSDYGLSLIGSGTITGNAFQDCGSGLSIFNPGSLVCSGNGFFNNGYHFYLLSNDMTTFRVDGNDFSGTGIVEAEGDNTLDATGNYWGSGEDARADQPRAVSGAILTTDPFLTEDPFLDFP